MPDAANHLDVVTATPEDLTPDVVDAAATLLQDLVRDGAALGWVEPPSTAEVADLLRTVAADAQDGDAALGRALVTALVGAARDAGVEVLTLDLRGDNLRAERLYASVGFTRHGVLERFVAVRDRRYDKVLMSFDLRA